MIWLETYTWIMLLLYKALSHHEQIAVCSRIFLIMHKVQCFQCLCYKFHHKEEEWMTKFNMALCQHHIIICQATTHCSLLLLESCSWIMWLVMSYLQIVVSDVLGYYKMWTGKQSLVTDILGESSALSLSYIGPAQSSWPIRPLRWKQYTPPWCLCPFNTQHSITIQKTWWASKPTVKTSDVTYLHITAMG